MQDLQPSSTPLSNNHSRIATIVIAVFSLVGFADAGFLSYEHFYNALPPCSIVHGCESVLTSSYASILGIPVAYLGLAYYTVLFLLAVAVLAGNVGEMAKRGVIWLPKIGFLMSLYFVGLQLFVIHAICLYCMTSAGSSTVNFIASFFVKLDKNTELQ